MFEAHPNPRPRFPRVKPEFLAGLAGASAATWAAVSPSLLPRPWWVTAANVAVAQTVGHMAGSAAAFAARRLLPPNTPTIPGVPAVPGTYAAAGMAAVTAGFMGTAWVNHARHARLVEVHSTHPLQAAGGVALGTAAFGVALGVGEAVQGGVGLLSGALGRWMPGLVAFPVAAGAAAGAAWLASNQLVWRRVVREWSARAVMANRRVFPGAMMPWEPERSGSPWSYEPWTAVGAQGRRVLSSGPRAADIREVMGVERAHEPIRVYIGLVPGRGAKAAARQAMAELERTGAFHRNTIVVQMPAGSGWLNTWSVTAVEFLTRGACATVTVQFDYLPSVASHVVNPQAAPEFARELIAAVRARVDTMPADNRPHVYLAGESLGAYAITEGFADLEELLGACNGAVFSGPPRLTPFFQRLPWDAGSLERLPLVGGGKHVRFVAAPAHTRHDAWGRSYAHRWQRPRVVVAQHASDPIVWWDAALAFVRPRWMREPQPPTLRADAFRFLPWTPIITWWQVGLDQIGSLGVPGGHGHNYFSEMLTYWDCVLGSQSRERLTPLLARRIARFITAD